MISKNHFPAFIGKAPTRYIVFLIVFLYQVFLFNQASAQMISPGNSLYEQASEVSGLIIQYGQDINAIRDFYSPYTKIDGYEDQTVQTSPEERKRLAETGNDYLEKLKHTD